MPSHARTRPLSRFERAMLRTQRHQPFNAVVVIRVRPAPDPAAWRRGLDEVQALHPNLGCRIGPGPSFEPTEGAIPLEVETWREGGWQEVVEQELNRVIDLDRGPLASAVLLSGPERADLVLTVPHLVIDAPSGGRLVDELLRRVATGRGSIGEPVLPVPAPEGRLPEPWTSRIGRWRVPVAVGRQMVAEARVALATRRARRYPVRPGARSRAVCRVLDRSATSALLAVARRWRVTLNSLVTAASLEAVNRHLFDGARRPVRVMTAADLRPYLDPPLSSAPLGVCFAMVNRVVDVAPEDGLRELADRVQAGLAAAFARGEKYSSYLAIEPMIRMGIASRRLRFTDLAIATTDAGGIAPRYGEVAVEGLEVFVANTDVGPVWSVQARTHDGRLRLGAVYLEEETSAETAARVADETLARLEEAT